VQDRGNFDTPTKVITKYEGPKIFLAAPFFELFLKLAAEKKDSKRGAARNFLALFILS
jgi:hypothetical protein